MDDEFLQKSNPVTIMGACSIVRVDRGGVSGNMAVNLNLSELSNPECDPSFLLHLNSCIRPQGVGGYVYDGDKLYAIDDHQFIIHEHKVNQRWLDCIDFAIERYVERQKYKGWGRKDSIG